LLDWTNPGHVGSLTEWKNKVAKPLRVGQSHDANNKQLSQARVLNIYSDICLQIENRTPIENESASEILTSTDQDVNSRSIAYENR